jgi:hypothetical protein
MLKLKKIIHRPSKATARPHPTPHTPFDRTSSSFVFSLKYTFNRLTRTVSFVHFNFSPVKLGSSIVYPVPRVFFLGGGPKMRSLMGFELLLCLGILGIVNATLNPIVIKGNAFFDSVTNDRFYIRGVDYQVRNQPTPPSVPRSI